DRRARGTTTAEGWSGNSRFSCAVSTRGLRRSRADHVSSEGIVFTFFVVATERRCRQRRWIVGVLAGAAVLVAAPYGARAQLPPAGTDMTPPAAPPSAAAMPAPALTPTTAAPVVAPVVPDTEIKIRLDSPAGVAVAGERLHTALLRRFYAAHNYEPVWNTRQAMASALLNSVMRAGEHGLDPELFHATQLRDS